MDNWNNFLQKFLSRFEDQDCVLVDKGKKIEYILKICLCAVRNRRRNDSLFNKERPPCFQVKIGFLFTYISINTQSINHWDCRVIYYLGHARELCELLLIGWYVFIVSEQVISSIEKMSQVVDLSTWIGLDWEVISLRPLLKRADEWG